MAAPGTLLNEFYRCSTQASGDRTDRLSKWVKDPWHAAKILLRDSAFICPSPLGSLLFDLFKLIHNRAIRHIPCQSMLCCESRMPNGRQCCKSALRRIHRVDKILLVVFGGEGSFRGRPGSCPGLVARARVSSIFPRRPQVIYGIFCSAEG